MKRKYNVIYSMEGREVTKTIEADSPGRAFYFCKRMHPNATLIKCFLEGWRSYLGSDFGYSEWEAPKNQELPKPLIKKKDTDQTTMDELLQEAASFK